MSLGKLTIDLLMKTGQFETDIKRADKRLKQFKKDASDSAKAIGLSFAAGAAVGLGIFVAQIKSAVNAADEMGKMAQKVGVTTEALSALTFAASQSEVEVGQLQKALAKVSVDLVQSNSDLRALGVTATTSDQALIQLADIFTSLPDGLQKTALAAKIFGERIGPDLIPLLNLGAKGINELKERAQELGIVISDDMARDADRFNDTMDEVKGAMQGAFLTVAKDLLPSMQEFASYMASDEAQKGIRDVTRLLIAMLKLSGQAASAIGAFANPDIGINDIQPEGNRAPASAAELQYQESLLAQFKGLEKNKAANTITVKGVRPQPSPSIIGKIIGSKSGGPSAKAASESKAKAAADRDAEVAARALAEANESLNRALDAQSAQLGGPLVSAAQEYRDEMVKLSEIEKTLSDQGKLDLDAQNRLNIAREQALTLYQQTTDAITNQLTPAQEQIKYMEQELSLLKLSNEERARAAFLMDNPDATDAQADKFADLSKQRDETMKTTAAMDQFRSSAADAFESVLDGSASAADAFKSFAGSVISQITRIIAQNLAESLFGSFGSSGGGAGGNFLGDIFRSLFGGGLAGGGHVQPGKFYRVNENQPEVLSYRGEDFLMNAGGGLVKQNTGNKSSNVTINLPPSSGRRSELQAAQRAGEETRRALARNA